MLTPNKFSKPDTLACNCLRLPHQTHRKQRETSEKESHETVQSQQSQQPDMTGLPDAPQPRDQWPAEWYAPETGSHAQSPKKDTSGNQTGSAKVDGVEEEIVKDKLADGVLKIAIFR
ncbi:hypothetical protein GGR55DRAFT_675484 [Xylaria sp. FL0064]|nr:hypothetical protein GGR55DRAFT_675484 [Xylaria sp. FL0064]